MTKVNLNRRLVGGVAAVALGAALFAGSGHTFAKWFDSEPSLGQAITSGQLHVESTGTRSLSVSHAGGTATPVTDLTSFLIVPGDVASYTIPLTLTVTGNNNQATLALDLKSLIAGTQVSGVDGSQETSELLTALTDNVTVSIAPTDSAPPLTPVAGQANTFTVPTGTVNAQYTATIAVKFAAASGSDTPDTPAADGTGGANWWDLTAQNQQVSFANTKFTLTQNVPTV